MESPKVQEGIRVNINMIAGITKMPVMLNEGLIKIMLEKIMAGKIEPIYLRKSGDGYTLIDGFHAMEAYKRASCETVIATVFETPTFWITKEDIEKLPPENANASSRGQFIDETSIMSQDLWDKLGAIREESQRVKTTKPSDVYHMMTLRTEGIEPVFHKQPWEAKHATLEIDPNDPKFLEYKEKLKKMMMEDKFIPPARIEMSYAAMLNFKLTELYPFDGKNPCKDIVPNLISDSYRAQAKSVFFSNLQQINRGGYVNRGGYINDYGCRVPNPCGEIGAGSDGKPRDYDKIGLLMHPGWKHTDEILDALNRFIIPTCQCVQVILPVHAPILDDRRRIFFHRPGHAEECIPTRWTASQSCTLCNTFGRPLDNTSKSIAAPVDEFEANWQRFLRGQSD